MRRAALLVAAVLSIAVVADAGRRRVTQDPNYEPVVKSPDD